MEAHKPDSASKGRRRRPNEEWATHTKLAWMLQTRLDPLAVFWTSLENKPSSRLNGFLQKRRGVRGGLPDLLFIVRVPHKIVWIEVKSRAGIASKKQRQVYRELRAMGCDYWLVRSIRAAFTAFHRSGVPLLSPEKPHELEDWEGPFSDPTRPLPQHPVVRAQRRERHELWRRNRGMAARRTNVSLEERRRRNREAVRRHRERQRAALIAPQ
jgi:VRR-NUC domain